jgi:hypothetical protein
MVGISGISADADIRWERRPSRPGEERASFTDSAADGAAEDPAEGEGDRSSSPRDRRPSRSSLNAPFAAQLLAEALKPQDTPTGRRSRFGEAGQSYLAGAPEGQGTRRGVIVSRQA